MKNVILQKAVLSVLGILIAVLLFLSPGLKLPVIDQTAETYFTEAITRGSVSYAICRVINASVSIIEESSMHLQPAGIGISLAVGQAVDPVDDMTERVADVLVTAVTSLGVQKLMYEIGVSLLPPVFAVLMVVLSLLVWFSGERMEFLQKTMTRFALLILIARFCLPVSSAINELINRHFFNGQIEEVNKELAVHSADLDKLKDFSLPEKSLLGTAAFLKRKSGDFRKALTVAADNMGNIIENLLRLTFLYVGILVIQVVLLPLLTFFFLIKTVNALFAVQLPQVIVYRPAKQNKEECA
ncbi:MAG: hypothetical protein ACL93V_10595 [Candidatus Electrothrix sp. YB6]